MAYQKENTKKGDPVKVDIAPSKEKIVWADDE